MKISQRTTLCELARFEPAANSTVFAVEEVAHGAAAGGVDFGFGFAPGVVDRRPRRGLGLGRFGLAARGAAVGKAGLAGMELKLLVTDHTGADRERHTQIW